MLINAQSGACRDIPLGCRGPGRSDRTGEKLCGALLCLSVPFAQKHKHTSSEREREREKKCKCFAPVTEFKGASPALCPALHRGTSELVSSVVLAGVSDVCGPCRELGHQRTVIELDTPSVTAEQVEALEKNVNEKIRARIPVVVREHSEDDPEIEMVSSNGGCWQNSFQSHVGQREYATQSSFSPRDMSCHARPSGSLPR